MNRAVTFVPSEFYHLYNRGVDKRVVFTSLSEYRRFISLLYACNNLKSVHISNQNRDKTEFLNIEKRDNSENLIDIGTYCLMPNHFHILVREVTDNGVSKFMQKLSTGYTMYFNKKHGRTGSLFEGTFKATHVTNDNYLKYLFSYIHLNPVKLIEPKWKENKISDRSAAEAYLKNYKHSGYIDHIGIQRVEQKILNIKKFPKYFMSESSFEKEVTEWLEYKLPL